MPRGPEGEKPPPDNWVRTHKAHGLTPAMAAGRTSSPMEMAILSP